MNRILSILILCVLCSFFSCKNDEELTIVGCYEIDKTVAKNRTNNILDYRFLEINKNNTFSLKYNNKDVIIQGKWVLEKINSEKSLVKFFYNNKKIEGTLNGNVFYFSYPNDFHNDKYESLLYVKLNKVNDIPN